MKHFTPILVHGRTHVLTDADDRRGSVHRCANYMHASRALCAVVPQGMTFEEWKRKHTPKK